MSAATELVPIVERPGPPTTMGGMKAVEAALGELQAFREFVKGALQPNLDYGAIPNTGGKPTLLQPGAQKIAMLFNAYPDQAVEPHELGGGHVEYVVTTRLISRVSSQVIGAGLGSASTMESRYRWRKGERTCPGCGQAAIVKGRDEYGGGWLCFAKKGGCGAKFRDGDPAIESQPSGRVENQDIHDVRNTVLKIACKRSLVSASMALGCASEMFTQDLDDWHGVEVEPAPTSPGPERERSRKPERRPDPEPNRGRTHADRREPARSEDSGPPRSGRALFAWAKDQEQRHQVALLKYLNNWGKLQEFPGRMVDWDADQVALAHAEAVRKLRAIPTPTNAEPAPAQPEARSESRTWSEFLGRFLAHWATIDPADARESESRRNKLINRLVSDAIAAGKIQPSTISRPNSKGEVKRDKARAAQAIQNLFESSDDARRQVRQWAKAYLDEKTAPAPAPTETEAPAPATILAPYDPPANAGDAWEPDGVDLLDRWAIAQEERTGLDVGRLVAEAARTRGLPDDPHQWSAVQIKHLVADVERVAVAAQQKIEGYEEALAN